MPNHRPLTAHFVRACVTPGRYGDGRGSKGLRLVVNASSVAVNGVTKSWVGEVRGADGRRVARGLGSYPAVSLSQARLLAAEHYVAVKSGEVAIRVPASAHRPMPIRTAMHGRTHALGRSSVPARAPALARTPTVAQALEAVIPLRKMKPATIHDWRSSLHRHAAGIMGEPVGVITSAHIIGVLKPIWQPKPALGRKVLQRLAVLMDWAKANNHRHDNPCDAVRAALPKNEHRVAHHRALPWSEAPALLQLTRSYRRPMIARLFEFVVATAARIGEARGAAWAEIDVGAQVWTVPAERMKAGREHRVPLSRFALGVLDGARCLAERDGIASPFVFPMASGRPLHRNAPTKMFAELGVDTTMHGFRSTFSDWAIEAGYDSMTVHRATAHHDHNAVRAAYQRTDRLEERRPIMQAWGEFLAG